ncbi:MAG: ABC transporter permease, partial [Methylobacter sp.]
MVILWTDALIFMLIFVMLGLAFFLHGKDHIKRPLQKISRSKVGMVSLVVLIFFVLIGLLDSVHFKPATDKGNEIISLLDYWATPLRKHGEKTYSAPFANTLYSKEIMTLADGASQWDYPRLQFGGAHLNNPETEKIPDILQRAFCGFAQGAGLFIFFMILLWSFLKEQHKSLMKSSTAKAVWAVLFFIVSLNYALIYLSAYYHVFGTDKVGEDVFYQAVKSIRTGLVIGTLTTLIMLPMAIVFGILAGFFRGWID